MWTHEDLPSLEEFRSLKKNEQEAVIKQATEELRRLIVAMSNLTSLIKQAADREEFLLYIDAMAVNLGKTRKEILSLICQTDEDDPLLLKAIELNIIRRRTGNV